MTCSDCADTGYRPDGASCVCDARPFEPAGTSHRDERFAGAEPMSRDEHKRLLIIEADNHAAVTTEVDDLMRWCRAALGPVIGLGELSYYAERQALDIVAGRVLAELDHLEAALVLLPPIVYRLRLAALDHLGEAAA